MFFSTKKKEKRSGHYPKRIDMHYVQKSTKFIDNIEKIVVTEQNQHRLSLELQKMSQLTQTSTKSSIVLSWQQSFHHSYI